MKQKRESKGFRNSRYTTTAANLRLRMSKQEKTKDKRSPLPLENAIQVSLKGVWLLQEPEGC